jgi:Pyridoxamine 5'-phosphate oxidase
MAAAPRDLIDEDLSEFFRGPVSAILASVDPMNVPDATRVMGLAALSPRLLRILVSHDARTAHTNAQPGARVAVLVTDITNYRSIQLKGTVTTGMHERTAGDMALVHHHIDTFCDSSPKVGITPANAALFFTVDVVAIVLEVDDLYDQTPGPGAGRRIVASR